MAMRSVPTTGSSRIVARMQRPKGNDVRRATFDGPPELAAFFRNGRLETIPAARDRRQAVLAHVAERFEPGREYGEDEGNRILQGVHADHGPLPRHLLHSGPLWRARRGYRKAL